MLEKIAIWGTGQVARNFFYKKCYKYDTQYFIDNYEPKHRIKNFSIYAPEDIDLKKYKIIIALTNWESVAEQLEKLGLSFFKHYLPYHLVDKNEVPIMEILAHTENLNDRESAITAYRGSRKLALINGNCQISRIKMFLQQNKEFNKEFVFLDIPPIYELSQNGIDLLMKNKDVFKKIKLFISQNISLNNKFNYCISNKNLIGLMDKAVQYIRIPTLFFDIYFPQGGKQLDPRKEAFARTLFPYSDAIIDDMANKKGFKGEGYSADEIIEAINMENFFSKDFLEWVIQYRLEQLRKREEECDIKMMDYIEREYLNEPLFYSRNHPTNKVLKEESIRILKYIYERDNMDIEHENTIPDLSINQEFIYPSIYHKLHPAFRKIWYSDAISKCSCTMEEEIKKYLFCCFDRK